MGGTYSDVPDYRFAYDRDGTSVVTIDNSNVITELTTAQKVLLNDEGVSTSITGSSNSITYLAFLFPEARTASAYFATVISGTKGAVQTSTDTTNGVDGTWNNWVSPFVASTVVNDDYRDSIQNPADVTSVKGVRFNMTSASCEIAAVHLYGQIPLAQSPDRLVFWQPVTNAEATAAEFDFDDVARGDSDVIQFRVKNNSSTLTANNVDVFFEALTESNPTQASQYTLSANGTSYSSAINIGNLANGAISSVLYVKRDTASNAQLGLWTGRLVTKASSWT